jgi:hypothetical protein
MNAPADVGWSEDPLPSGRVVVDASHLFPRCEETELGHWWIELKAGLTCRRCGDSIPRRER